MAKKQYQNIRLPTEMVERLRELGKKGDTYADIIDRLLKEKNKKEV